MSETNSRRDFLRHAAAGTAGVAVAAVPGIAAAADGAPDAMPPLARMRNPHDLYPRAPFARQVQPVPGLASKMVPRPDHGETSYRGSNRLAGRKALVTGGDSGIGRAAAIAFAREGADVAINYLPVEESDAREVVALIRKEGRKCVAIPGDIRTEAFCRLLVERAVAELGGLDVLVSNAGHQQARDDIQDISSEQFEQTMKTNVHAPFWIAKAALPHMPAGSSVILTTSEQAFLPSANLLDYAPTKAANIAFVKALAKQQAPRGIRVNAVAPGATWTPLQTSGGQPPEVIDRFGQDNPTGRPAQPVELAPLNVTLASAESSFSSGQVFGANGATGAA
ncbi:SDR family oxidoreductase [Burkholderia gladioli]|uniref:SDR family oxidoreductase n=1 Tax=Burkholderia gladioli TaxID=28095 RepID=UPI0016421A48|nr:SDR family oxidoreductase [Burkholderia gladioli]